MLDWLETNITTRDLAVSEVNVYFFQLPKSRLSTILELQLCNDL